MTDDKEEKTLEGQEHFFEIAKSRDVEVLEGKSKFVEFGGNLVPVTTSSDQLHLRFFAFRENRLPVTVKVKDPHSEPMGRIAFMKEPKGSRGDAPQTPICNLNVALPDNITPEVPGDAESITAIQSKYTFLREAGYGKFDTIHRVDLRISDIGNLLGSDWVKLAHELAIPDSDINIIKSEYPDNDGQQAMVMLRLWLNDQGNMATGNALEKALRKCDREDIVNKCIVNVELVTDETEQSAANKAIEQDQAEFQSFKAELDPSHSSTLRRDEIVEEKHATEELITEKEATIVRQEQTHITDETQSSIEEEFKSHKLSSFKEEIVEEVVVKSEPIFETEESSSTTTMTTTEEVTTTTNKEQLVHHEVYEREEQKYVAEEKDVERSRKSSSSSSEMAGNEEEPSEHEDKKELALTPPPSPSAALDVVEKGKTCLRHPVSKLLKMSFRIE